MKLPDLRKTRLSSVSTFGVVSILGTSMIIIAIVAIAAIRGAGAYSLKQTKEAIKTEAVKLLQENTKRKADEYSQYFKQGQMLVEMMGDQVKILAEKSSKFKFNPLVIKKYFRNFKKENSAMPYSYYNKYKNVLTVIPNINQDDIRKRIYTYSLLQPLFSEVASLDKGFYQTWLADYSINYQSNFYGEKKTKIIIPKLENYLKSMQEGYIGYLKTPAIYISEVYKDIYGPIVLTISNLENDNSFKFLIGIDFLFYQVVTDVLKHRIPLISDSNLSEKSNSFTFIITDKGNLVAISNGFFNKLGFTDKVENKVALVQDLEINISESKYSSVTNLTKMINKYKFGTKAIDIGDKEYLFCFHKMSIKNWIFAVAVPTKDLYKAVTETEARMGVTVMGFIINFLMVAVFFMFILLIVVVLFFKTYLVKPILSFRDNVLQMGDGDLDTPIKERGVYEISVLANSFNNLRVDLKNHMEGLRSEVVKRQKRDNELKTARQVQLSVLPKITSLFDNKGIELYAKLLPAIDVAGDYYDFFFLENKKLALIIADVSGKGISASFYMAVTKRTLRNTCITEPDDPAKSIELANKILCSYNINMFVTLFLAYYDTETGEMVYANGGHNEVICLKNNGSIDVFGVLNCAALGTFPELPYVKASYTLDHGDTIYVYTDGIIEANTGDENFYGMKRFEDLLVKNREKSLSKICKLVIQDVHQFEKGGQFDDITILALKRE